jgi:hypothetical protein
VGPDERPKQEFSRAQAMADELNRCLVIKSRRKELRIEMGMTRTKLARELIPAATSKLHGEKSTAMGF